MTGKLMRPGARALCMIKHELKIPPPYATATPPAPPLLQCSCTWDQELACARVLGGPHGTLTRLSSLGPRCCSEAC